MTEEFVQAWAEETARVHEGYPMLSWEACEMIAYNRVQEKFEDENNNQQVSQEG